MSVKVSAKCLVCDWKGNGTNSNGMCPKCMGPIIATKVEVKK